MDLSILLWGNYPRLSGGPDIITSVPKERGRRRDRQRRRPCDDGSRVKRCCALLPLKIEEGIMSQILQLSLEAGKGEDTESPLEPPGGTSPAKHLELSPLRLILDF